MAEFATLDNSNPNIPFAGSNVSENALGLVNPDSVLSGTNRGTQNIGGPNFVSDPSNSRLLVYDGVADRVEIGKIGTGVNDWGMKVSKPTIDVRTATNDQLIFNSAQNVFKVVLTGTASITGTDNSGGTTWINYSQTIAHNLGYKPVVMGFVEGVTSDGLGTQTFRRPTPAALFTLTVSGSVFPWLAYAEVLADSTNVICRWLGNGGSNWSGQTVTFKYYLLQESAA